MTAAGPDPQYVLEQYEALRHEALAAAARWPRGQGLSLFLARGLPGWLSALTALGSPEPARRLAGERSAARPRLLPAARVELTTVLAGMVLACAPATEG